MVENDNADRKQIIYFRAEITRHFHIYPDQCVRELRFLVWPWKNFHSVICVPSWYQTQLPMILVVLQIKLPVAGGNGTPFDDWYSWCLSCSGPDLATVLPVFFHWWWGCHSPCWNFLSKKTMPINCWLHCTLFSMRTYYMYTSHPHCMIVNYWFVL